MKRQRQFSELAGHKRSAWIPKFALKVQESHNNITTNSKYFICYCILLGGAASQYFADAAYCYRRGSVVCLSVCL